MPPCRIDLAAGILFLAAFAGSLPAQILAPGDFSSAGSFASIGDISRDTDGPRPVGNAVFSEWTQLGENEQGLEDATQKVEAFASLGLSESSLDFLRTVGSEGGGSVPQSDLAPIPEPAAVVMVIVAGMLTIFRRRSRPA